MYALNQGEKYGILCKSTVKTNTYLVQHVTYMNTDSIETIYIPTCEKNQLNPHHCLEGKLFWPFMKTDDLLNGSSYMYGDRFFLCLHIIFDAWLFKDSVHKPFTNSMLSCL